MPETQTASAASSGKLTRLLALIESPMGPSNPARMGTKGLDMKALFTTLQLMDLITAVINDNNEQIKVSDIDMKRIDGSITIARKIVAGDTTNLTADTENDEQGQPQDWFCYAADPSPNALNNSSKTGCFIFADDGTATWTPPEKFSSFSLTAAEAQVYIDQLTTLRNEKTSISQRSMIELKQWIDRFSDAAGLGSKFAQTADEDRRETARNAIG
jgi:hypothetical protein